jgi:hypothetical protein
MTANVLICVETECTTGAVELWKSPGALKQKYSAVVLETGAFKMLIMTRAL